MQDGEVWLTQDGIAQLFDVDRSVVTKHLKNIFQDGELAEKETRAKFTQVADNGKPINIIQDKNYQSDFDRLMAETAETKYPNCEHHTCFELFYRNTGGFLFGKPCIAGLSAFYK